MAFTEELDWSRRCQQCNGIIPDEAHMLREFCSRKCNTAYFNGLRDRANAERRAALRCVVCGEPMRAKHAGGKYCSTRCKNRFHEAKTRAKYPERKCATCGGSFRSRFARAKYCSSPCFLTAIHASARRQPAKTCPICKTQFDPKTFNAKFCSVDCGKASRRGANSTRRRGQAL